MTMLAMILPGVAVTYYGEEIGMIDTYVSWNDTQDPQACNTDPDRFEAHSRDPNRSPFQWDATTSAGEILTKLNHSSINHLTSRLYESYPTKTDFIVIELNLDIN